MSMLSQIENSFIREHKCILLISRDGEVEYENLLADLVHDREILLITTPTVNSLYGSNLRTLIKPGCRTLAWRTLTGGEAAKREETVLSICRWAQDVRLPRDGILIACGGGVCTDVVGMAASIIRRGIKYIRIPTTLVGQIDAGIGLKTGINFNNKKNYLGSFYPPAAVLIDYRYLRSLDQIELRQGMSEIVKIAVVRNKKLFVLMETHGAGFLKSKFQEILDCDNDVLLMSIQDMLSELRANPFEEVHAGRLADFGHTFSPHLEDATGYTLKHGDAVSIDIALSCLLGEELGVTPSAVSKRVLQVLGNLSLPLWNKHLSVDLCLAACAAAAEHRRGRLNLVVPTEVGVGSFIEDLNDITPGSLVSAINRLQHYGQATFAAK